MTVEGLCYCVKLCHTTVTLCHTYDWLVRGFCHSVTLTHYINLALVYFYYRGEHCLRLGVQKACSILAYPKVKPKPLKSINGRDKWYNKSKYSISFLNACICKVLVHFLCSNLWLPHMLTPWAMTQSHIFLSGVFTVIWLLYWFYPNHSLLFWS